MTDKAGADRPYRIEGKECRTLAELACALRDNWDLGKEHLTGGYVGKWIEEALGDIDAKIALDKLIKDSPVEDRTLFVFAARHDRGHPPEFKGTAITWESLKAIAQGEHADDFPKRQFLFEIYRAHALETAAELTGDPRLADLDRKWRAEFSNYCMARAEFLSCNEIWEDHSGSLSLFVADPQGEAFFLQHFSGGRTNPEAADLLLTSSKERLFDLMFVDDTARSTGSFREEDHYPDACRRAWFARLDREDMRSIGRDLHLSSISMIASAEYAQLARRKSEIEAGRKDAGKDWPIPLDQRAHAIGYGALMVLAALMEIWNPNGWSFGEKVGSGMQPATLLTAFYCATLYGARAPQRSMAKVLGVGFLAYLFAWVPFMLLASGIVIQDALVFGGLFALLGWIRSPLIRRKRNARFDAEQAQIERSLAGSDEQEEDIEVVLGYMDFHSRGIPRREIVAHTRRQRAFEAGYNGGTVAPSAPQGARGAGPAAYQTDGIGYDIMGMNVGADGAITTEIVDGLSIDTKGRRNVRLVDGVTLHSDGKTTTNIAKGLDIRSDGQITTEMFGIKASWGGKEDKKKKDSWF